MISLLVRALSLSLLNFNLSNTIFLAHWATIRYGALRVLMLMMGERLAVLLQVSGRVFRKEEDLSEKAQLRLILKNIRR